MVLLKHFDSSNSRMVKMKSIKTTFRIYAASAVAAIGLFASCQQQNIETPDSGSLSGKELVTVTLKASMVQTKVSYTETPEKNLQPGWMAGDRVIGFDEGNDPYEFSISDIDEASGTATLTGVAPANCELHLVYLGCATPSAIEGLSLPYEFNYSGQASNTTIPAVMLADGEVIFGAGEFHFSNAGAVMGIKSVKGVPKDAVITKVTVYGDKLSSASIGLNDNKLALTTGGSTGESITTGDLTGIKVTDGIGTLSNKVLIAVPAEAIISKISLESGEYTYNCTLSNPITISANEYRYIEGKIFKSNKPAYSSSGLFSVGPDKQVYISKSNLEYQASTNTWRFAEKAYDYIGHTGGNITTPKSARAVQSDWIDLFPWAATGRKDINEYLAQPFEDSWDDKDYKTQDTGSKTEMLTRENGGDWGVCMGEDWRILTIEEWQYLLNIDGEDNVRKNKVKYSVLICNRFCSVLIPDDYDGTVQYIYDASSWQDAEDMGLRCIPYSGTIFGSFIGDFGEAGYIWTSSPNAITEDDGVCICVSCDAGFDYNFPLNTPRSSRCSVRLVKDAN